MVNDHVPKCHHLHSSGTPPGTVPPPLPGQSVSVPDYLEKKLFLIPNLNLPWNNFGCPKGSCSQLVTEWSPHFDTPRPPGQLHLVLFPYLLTLNLNL